MNPTETATATLEGHVRLASWKPADLRAEASTLADGCHMASEYLTADVAAAAAATMRAEADRLEAEAAAAQAELDRRKATRNAHLNGRRVVTPGRLA